MTAKLAITALGADRPGIVDELSNEIYQSDLNIEDSCMSLLGSEFAMLLLVSGTEDAITGFADNRPAIEQKLNMQMLMKKAATSTGSRETPLVFDVVAIDNPGIVHHLASFFSSRAINIASVKTEHYAAAHTATPMFSVSLSVNIPAAENPATIEADFIDYCESLNLDATINPST